MAEGLHDTLVTLISRNYVTTKHPISKLESRAYRVALFADGRRASSVRRRNFF